MASTIAIHEDSVKHVLYFTNRSQVSFEYYIIQRSTLGNAHDHNQNMTVCRTISMNNSEQIVLHDYNKQGRIQDSSRGEAHQRRMAKM